ncbi:hypothetical protein ABZZ79_20250 [Streptomyces sp. NPDC006458]|uniref:hypothetical protein n=1 Tax=Streptomyces sp. NPDC006458 TaxID=3154302 RepID=UPI0033BBFE2E
MTTDPLDTVRDTTAARDRALQAAEAARTAQHAAIAEAARQGAKQQDIVKITGLTRERVRQITRAAGIQSQR